jgi:hypothetical protein
MQAEGKTLNFFNKWMRTDAPQYAEAVPSDECPEIGNSGQKSALKDLQDSDETVVAQVLRLAKEQEPAGEEKRGFDPYNTGRFESN